jgi:hypothetical protein
VRKVNRSSQSKTSSGKSSERGSRVLLPALVAVGGSLAALPASGLELGELKVHSTLGQPLRASIAYALAPNEALYDTCVSVQQAAATTGLPGVGRASLIVTDGVIAITGSRVIQDPLMSMRVNIRCPYTPQLSREYTLFIDPADGAAVEPVAAARAPATSPVTDAAATTAPAVVRTVAPRRQSAAPAAIGNATRYRVQVGDSLSEIAQRIENRPIGLWPAVNAIFEANPDAFIDNDPNKLKAGSWLTIPDFAAAAPVTVAGSSSVPAAADAGARTPQPVAAGAAYEPAVLKPALPAADTVTVAPAVAEPLSVETVTVQADAGNGDNAYAGLQPGDVVVGAEDPAGILDDIDLEGPVASSSSPNVPVAIIQRPAAAQPEPASTGWFAWLAGGGLAIIGGLLLFGRLRNRFGSTPIGAAPAHPLRRHTDGDTQKVETIGDVDVGFGEETASDNDIMLDADLYVGTGLQDGADVDIAQDFAFASTTSLDLELPEEMSSGGADDTHLTDVIPPLRANEETILESEVLPDEDDYDMSVIMDATKMPHPEDVTERDLEAIPVSEHDDETLITDDYTVSQEVDYKILEQDYEDEMTATQVLNAEIARAAEEMAAGMDADAKDDSTEISMASVHELDITAQLRGRNDDISDLDDTGINEQTVHLEADDKTVEMESDDREVTAEMRVKSSR